MALVKLKTPCKVRHKHSTDVYGQPIYGPAKPSKCAVLKLLKSRQPTTVRTDSSGTRGHADEVIADAHLLMLATEPLDLDDFIEVSGFTIRVSAIRHRYDTGNTFDHKEVEGSIE